MRTKLQNKKGFTLAELLIVVAIIAVLVAVSIPVFTAQLEKAKEATDVANIRSAYAEQSNALITWDGTSEIANITVDATQAQDKWQSEANSVNYSDIGGVNTVAAKTKGNNWIVVADTTNMKVTIN